MYTFPIFGNMWNRKRGARTARIHWNPAMTTQWRQVDIPYQYTYILSLFFLSIETVLYLQNETEKSFLWPTSPLQALADFFPVYCVTFTNILHSHQCNMFLPFSFLLKDDPHGLQTLTHRYPPTRSLKVVFCLHFPQIHSSNQLMIPSFWTWVIIDITLHFKYTT